MFCMCFSPSGGQFNIIFFMSSIKTCSLKVKGDRQDIKKLISNLPLEGAKLMWNKTHAEQNTSKKKVV